MILFSCLTPFSELASALLSFPVLMDVFQSSSHMIVWRLPWICGMYMQLQPVMYMADAITRSALVLGILYLAFQAFPIIFEDVHGFNVQQTGLSFLGIGIGMFAALGTQPYWNG